MTPETPIVPGYDLPVTPYAANQPEYQTLPTCRDRDGMAISRWHCSFVERLRVLCTDDIYLSQLTFNRPMQPVQLDTLPPIFD
ncbi:MAG: hypothetical protein MOB07_31610 [Acidobacteria bacterium]|nr:hypothetical protein [Acidobacteriota bacterium]